MTKTNAANLETMLLRVRDQQQDIIRRVGPGNFTPSLSQIRT
jgi:hypothetical protein